MGMSQRFEGRNLEEALNSAAETFAVQRWQLTYHVLLEKRGFLGGVKRVVIEADVNETAPPPQSVAPSVSAPAAQPSALKPAAQSEARPAREPRGPRPERGNRGGGGGRGRGRRGGGGGGPRRDHRDELQSGDFEQFFGELPEQGPESDNARVVREWCDRLLSLARIGVVSRTEENETQIIVRLHGGDTKRMTEKHGELLDAVQVLANKALGQKIEKDIELDCESFKDQRVQELQQRAKEVAERVRRDRAEEMLPAMTPIERRIVHLTLQDDADVTTESRGEGFYKRVAVVLRSEAAPKVDAAPQP